jgi:hypothetical protein|tara:strand:+ start:40 stop:594 length:555 start_codon:yes stop_codon:yes gene_type:complete
MAIVYPNSMQGNAISEMWRMHTSFTGNANPMTNWEKVDDVGSYSPYYSSTNNNLLIENNGIFTFREKGGYLINYYFMAYHTQPSRYNVMVLELSWNNGANYDAHSSAYGSFPDANSGYSGTHEQTGNANVFLGIPAVDGDGSSTRKIKFKMQVQNGSNGTYGSTSQTYTGFTVSKLTDHIHQPS